MKQRYALPGEGRRRSSGAGRLLALLALGAVVLVVGLGIGYFLFSAPTGRPVSVSAPQPATGQAPVAQAPQPPPPRPPKPAGSGDEARALIEQVRERGGPPALDEIFAEARRHQTENRLADAHLLYFFAAREGHAPSARVLGSFYDPNQESETPTIMDEPDVEQAYKWYSRAAAAGDALAVDRLESLRVLVESEARDGDPEAKRLLLEWDTEPRN